MSVKININQAAIQSKIKKAATDKIMHGKYQIECPHCHAKIQAAPGENICPFCHNRVKLTMDINFK